MSSAVPTKCVYPPHTAVTVSMTVVVLMVVTNRDVTDSGSVSLLPLYSGMSVVSGSIDIVDVLPISTTWTPMLSRVQP